MELINLTLKEFANEVESLSPAPGGGSCAAYSGVVATCLTRMVGNLTFGKKRFLALTEIQQKELEDNFDSLLDTKKRLLELVDEDTLAFNKVMNAFKLPKETAEQKSRRQLEIDTATWESAEVPMEVARISYRAMDLLSPFLDNGNPNAVTDMGVAYLMMATAVEGAILNVKINLGSVIDSTKAKAWELECNDMLSKVHQLRDASLEKVHGCIALT